MRIKRTFDFLSGAFYSVITPTVKTPWSKLYLCGTQVFTLWSYLPISTRHIEVTLKTQEPKTDLDKWESFLLSNSRHYFLLGAGGKQISIDDSIHDFLVERKLEGKWFWVTVKPVK